MRVTLHAVGKRMPAWVRTGFEEYAKRLPSAWRFSVREHAPARGDTAEIRCAREGETLLAACDPRAWLVALDERGRGFDTEALGARLLHWRELGKPLDLVIGGPDGLDDKLRRRADELWSLSASTFPHPLVRVLVVEQLYRAESLTAGHPYHRA